MTNKPFFCHTTLKSRRDNSKRLTHLDIYANAQLWADAGMQDAEPITWALPDDSRTNPSDEKLGYMVDPQGRVVLRVCNEDDAAKLGTECCTIPELINFLRRIEDMADIENAALLAQARAVRLAQLMGQILPYIQRGEAVPGKTLVTIASYMHQIKQEDDEAEAARRKADLRGKYRSVA